MSDLDAIAEDIQMAERSAEMARHVALDHAPELIAEIKGLRAEVGLLRGGYNVRPMTEVESNLMTQVLELRRGMGAIRRGYREYEAALERREHGTVAAARFINVVIDNLEAEDQS
jgi:hypothetical protein